jgi:dipeptidyl-peptidase-4
MKRLFILATSLLVCCVVWAQNTVIDIRDSHPGKDLTMEEAIYNGVGYARMSARWLDNKTFLLFDGQGGFFSGSVEDPAHLTPYKWEPPKADEWDRGPAGYGVRTEGSSLLAEKDGETWAIGLSEDRNIVWGGTMMRNEFGFEKGWEWAPDGLKVAFYWKDQSRVTDFPLLNIKTRTGELEQLKYPMNGMASELLKVGVYDFLTRSITWLDVTDFSEERYITNLAWSKDSRFVYAQVLNREQEEMHLNQYSAANGCFVQTLLTEKSDAWVEPLNPVWPVKDGLLYRTDSRDGYRNLYLVDAKGIRRLTDVDADVEYVWNDGKYLYYTSAEVSPIENHLFRRPLRKGKAQQLTQGRGWHRVQLSDDGRWFLDRVANLNMPAKVFLCSTDGKKRIEIGSQRDPLDGYSSCQVELGSVPSADGAFENYYRLIYPKDFRPTKKYPVIVYVYGGPHSQMVQDAWLGQTRMWEMLMAQKGYLVYVQDNRGTSNRGAAFEKAINRRCGQAEMADQMVGIRRLMELPYVDSRRIGVHGWSYGGFMTISLMTHYPDVFKVGVAGGPVIDWKWYEIMYGERYMDTPERNPEGFAETSLIGKADNLKGKLLICQGAIDDTVVWEHSLSFIQQCIDLEIPVDYFPYPTARHNVFGRNRIHLMDKVTQYFEDYL